MLTRNSIAPFCRLFLFLGILGGCSEAPAPVLQIDLTGLLMDTGKIDIIVTRTDGKAGATAFFKDGASSFTQTMPSQPGAMPTTSVAVELPLGTSGTVKVRAEARSVRMPAAMSDMGAGPITEPAAEASGCTSAAIVPGLLTKIALRLMMPAAPCPM